MQIRQDYSNLISYKPSAQPSIIADDVSKEPTKDDITLAKFKKTMSECRYTAIAIGILYFSLRRLFRIEDISSYARNKNIISKFKKPKFDMPA